MRRQARTREKEAKARGVLYYSHYDYLKFKRPDQLLRWKALMKSEEYSGQIARSSEYCRAFRDLIGNTYKGIAWIGNVGWDGWDKAVNIYLVFHDEDLIPIPELGTSERVP